ncbi:thiamine pyrophosphate-binding protein [Agromyces aerolatus]|uniref:thiamine pyrophosphate-binding protein n=1 Tax=Agromyces sp. LY-1074 TaxID=3074080 RepID=UPI002862AF31|nr:MULTISPECIES: thiamine pyrophosphate-binding protein [unclassified Agromyces]MDR5700856.1 thiamine pyrophosphate-binding protein [Agromyces sp. LY-1074]MDR5707483.1 thiamine pyrophosphate-binding protein [Agromyces sp. LY-1358]
MSTTTETAAQALVRAMLEQGITTVFGTVGHGNLPLIDAIAGEPRMRFVSAYHEQVAIHAADAYFRSSGRVAAVVTTVGPGATNLATGLGDALLDSSAVLVITGGVPSEYVQRDPLQALSVIADNTQAEIFRPLTKRVIEVGSAGDLVREFSRAYAEAVNGRPGPVLLHVPLDYFSAPVEHAPAPARRMRFSPHADPQAISEAAELVRDAARPVLYCGGGALAPGAPEAVLALVNETGIPVVTTMSGQGVIDEDHDLALGTTGVVGTRTGNAAIREADVIIAVGTRFPEMDSSSWRPEYFAGFPPARLVHIDIDPATIDRVFPATVGVCADAGPAVSDLARALDGFRVPGSWTDRLATAKREWHAELAETRTVASVPFEPAYLLTRLRRLISDDTVLVSGVGVRHAVAQHFPVRRPRTLVVASGFGTMGQEVAAPLGVAEAGIPVVAVIGDGALLACLAALPTAVAADEDLTWIVLDNGGYASIAIYQSKHFGRRLGTDFIDDDGDPYSIDYAALASSFGAWTATVTSADELDGAVEAALAHRGPAVVVVPVTGQPRIQGTGHWDVNDIFAAGAAIAREATS